MVTESWLAGVGNSEPDKRSAARPEASWVDEHLLVVVGSRSQAGGRNH